MREVERIGEQHARAFTGPAWSGPAVFEVLRGVRARQAAARPVARGHTIWEIVLHVAAWEEVVQRRLRGERFSPADAQDWPSVGATPAVAWRRALALLRRRHRALQRAIASLSERRLGQRAAGQSYSVYIMVHGEIQHALYHAGQIALLRKARLG
jgi:uncharacterized damage-inducible protein DinB